MLVAYALGMAASLPAPHAFRLPARTVNAAFGAARRAMMQDAANGGPEADPSLGDTYSAARCTWTGEPHVADCSFRTRHFHGRARSGTNKLNQLDPTHWIAL